MGVRVLSAIASALVVSLVLHGVAHAQAATGTSASPAPTMPAAHFAVLPPIVLPETNAAQRRFAASTRLGRVGRELGASLGGYAGGAALGLLTGALIGAAVVSPFSGVDNCPPHPFLLCISDRETVTLLGAAIGAGLGALIGAAMSTYVIGHRLGNDGAFVHALLGAVVTTIGGVGMLGALVAAFPRDGTVTTGSNIAIGVCSVIGPILGSVASFELSARGRRGRPATTLAPHLSVRPGTATLGATLTY